MFTHQCDFEKHAINPLLNTHPLFGIFTSKKLEMVAARFVIILLPVLQTCFNLCTGLGIKKLDILKNTLCSKYYIAKRCKDLEIFSKRL